MRSPEGLGRLLRHGAATVLLTATLAACASRAGGPEPLPLDQVSCARCGMLISSDANAAEAIAPDEETRFYDDIGCMAADAAAAKAGAVRYVRLAATDGWALAESARFALSSTATTPMAHGVLAFATDEAARAADRDGRPRRWDEIVSMQQGGR